MVEVRSEMASRLLLVSTTRRSSGYELLWIFPVASFCANKRGVGCF
jgi:hypothetical protein